MDSPISVGIDLLQLRRGTDPTSKVNAELMGMMIKLVEQFGELSRQVRSLSLASQVAASSITPTGSFGFTSFGSASSPPTPLSPEVQAEIERRVVESARQAAEAARQASILRCRKCGETENFRVSDSREFNPRVDHYDLICGNCSAIVRQYHLVRADERKKEWSCPPSCQFHELTQ